MIYICEELQRHVCLILILDSIAYNLKLHHIVDTKHTLPFNTGNICQIGTLVYFWISRTALILDGFFFWHVHLAEKWHRPHSHSPRMLKMASARDDFGIDAAALMTLFGDLIGRSIVIPSLKLTACT